MGLSAAADILLDSFIDPKAASADEERAGQDDFVTTHLGQLHAILEGVCEGVSGLYVGLDAVDGVGEKTVAWSSQCSCCQEHPAFGVFTMLSGKGSDDGLIGTEIKNGASKLPYNGRQDSTINIRKSIGVYFPEKKAK
jgi:hypothetical protein